MLPRERVFAALEHREPDRIPWGEHSIDYNVYEHAAPGGGYIMGSTHSLAVDAKAENILEMKRCRDEWGNYPIKIK